MPVIKHNVRWIVMAAALLIPAVVVAVGMPQDVRIPIVKPHDKSEPPDAALFSHWSHNQFQCSSCHPSVFPQARKGFTHLELKEGKYCAACHNGKRAFSVDDADVECETCHVEK